jgi:hypothetical protein
MFNHKAAYTSILEENIKTPMDVSLEKKNFWDNFCFCSHEYTFYTLIFESVI